MELSLEHLVDSPGAVSFRRGLLLSSRLITVLTHCSQCSSAYHSGYPHISVSGWISGLRLKTFWREFAGLLSPNFFEPLDGWVMFELTSAQNANNRSFYRVRTYPLYSSSTN